MSRSWYFDSEEELEDRNEAIGRAYHQQYLEQQRKEQEEAMLKSQKLNSLYVHQDGQVSLFEENLRPAIIKKQAQKAISHCPRITPVKVAKRNKNVSKLFIEGFEAEVE